MTVSITFPQFPWDLLVSYKDLAKGHPSGLIDVSIGSPIDPTPRLAVAALKNAGQAPSYPTAGGTPQLIESMGSWWFRRRNTGFLSESEVFPSSGSKEMISLLPLLLGLGSQDVVVVPEIAYPTYAVGARLVGATVVAEDDPSLWPKNAKLVWLNSPSNPTGTVLGSDRLRAAVVAAREIGAVIASDECYAEFGWDEIEVPSLLDIEVCEGDRSGLLALSSLSKQSNLAGYRAALVAGDEELVASLVLARKHMGLIVPSPVQAVMTAVLGDDSHVEQQKRRYGVRRQALSAGLEGSGAKVEASEGGLYLWVTTGEKDWTTVEWFARRGILVTPGSFYGPDGAEHVRIAVTVSDPHVSELVQRLRP